MDFPRKGVYVSASPEETLRIGEKLGGRLKPGSIAALKGTLGAGKTVLARGIARALGVTEDLTSPTYTIINEYESGTIPLYHMDAYRLSGGEDFRLSGGEEKLYGEGVSVLEWPERISLPPSVLWIELTIMPDGRRSISYEDTL